MSGTAVITTVQGRHDHLRNQYLGLQRSTTTEIDWVVVAMGDPFLTEWQPGGTVSPRVVQIPAPGTNLPLASARNAGARAALARGATTLIFLDVDCVPAPALVRAYEQATQDASTADRLVCGPVSYLPPPPGHGYDLDTLADLAAPHPGRPAPLRGEVVAGGDPDLFWSLSFAVHTDTWRRLGGFCDRYVGYGGEDTDFGHKARALGVDIVWLGSARAYHQHHPTYDPPTQHVADIVRNGALFYHRWGFWPMTGWLDAFVERGLVRPTLTGYEMT
ncbi:MAG: galactosyltransferase-related protein [Actinomycetota bacterium]|nr:galactosyltransferase-related protein [Actinomycetota bacterium]